ncbi:dehydrodolichyl diphosphate synthase complex subunit Nus1 [Wyeomyia smithii]|uniref:dehydrodolichyl diphosphate synthase complex subunit Nus1 n=1 Tax=Wyeomyia smithii TaxID=174621 RepID=UPI002467E8F5|nr:dehydrodolichyl diphosphate synthase complex subunit Nus1 [Wyeomyia smithii]
MSSLPAKALLWLTHMLFSIVTQLINTVRWLKRHALKRYTRNHLSHKQESDVIQRTVQSLEKVPRHLAVILGPECPDYSQLVRFIPWCLSAKIEFVSFYDQKGLLKANFHRMMEHVQQQLRDQNDQIVWTPQLKSTGALLPPRNGYRRRIVVNFFSHEDGRKQLVTAARSISTELRNGTLSKPSEITVELVDQTMQNLVHQVPDPELAVYFGTVCCTYGMLPWQIRLTEFVSLQAPSLAELGVEHFINSLYKYAKCEQRFGK